jgi:hypothetical protein
MSTLRAYRTRDANLPRAGREFDDVRPVREMSSREMTLWLSGYTWAVCVGALALAGCGSETFLPSAPGDFEPRTLEDDVLVMEPAAPEMVQYQRIGTAFIKAKKDLNAIKGCRAVAAENGGDAILTPESKGKKEWQCTILRRKAKYTSETEAD